MLVDARERFAARTAAWIINDRLPKEEVVQRLNQFEKDHITLIGQQAKKLRSNSR